MRLAAVICAVVLSVSVVWLLRAKHHENAGAVQNGFVRNGIHHWPDGTCTHGMRVVFCPTGSSADD